MAHEGVLRTRLLPPRLPSDHVPRPDLTAAVAAGLQRRLVAVVAGAGYGKTTLLRLTLARPSAVPHPGIAASSLGASDSMRAA